MTQPQPPFSINHDEVWKQHRACLGHPNSDLWFPEEGESGLEGRRICASCPVREDCLQHALANGEKWGTWGGASERVRRHLRRLHQTCPHGPFRKRGCRCMFCEALDDHDQRMRALAKGNPADRLVDAGPGARHGTAARYARGCRCEPCRDAMRASRRRNQNRNDQEAS